MSDAVISAPEPARTFHKQCVVLLAKSAIAADPQKEMRALTEVIESRLGGVSATFAFSEQGLPALRDRLIQLDEAGVIDVSIAPLLVPMEPNFRVWILASIQRFRKSRPGSAMRFRVGPAPAVMEAYSTLAVELSAAALQTPQVEEKPDKPLGSIVPKHDRRLVVCMGGPCSDKGAALTWGHLRNEQQRLDLRNKHGLMSAKASCLGPCNLAPVVQVYPEGIYYGGIGEAEMDRIIESHLVGGQPVVDLIYEPSPKKQLLRN